MPQRVPLILAPTPLHRLDRLSADLALDLWIKRDDLTGLALGGNKGRKLEYLIAEALASGADTVVSCGSLQSNFIRQLGAACAVYGLRCVACVMELPFDSAAGRPRSAGIGSRAGNVALDEILGVELRLFEDDDWEVLFEHTENVALEMERGGARVYRIPVGGSSPLGALAFFQAGRELIEQEESPFDWIVHATSSGATQTGLTYAFRETSTRVLGVACDPEPGLGADFAKVGEGLATMLGVGLPVRANEFLIDFDSVGEGYGIPSAEGTAAIELLARREGIFLDPVYSGKAFAALLRLARSGGIGGRVLFWHTGGVPALMTG